MDCFADFLAVLSLCGLNIKTKLRIPTKRIAAHEPISRMLKAEFCLFLGSTFKVAELFPRR